MTYFGHKAYNRRYGHFVSVGMRRIFFGGHQEAYKRFWGSGEPGFVDHSLMVVQKDGSEEQSIELVKYEEGADYDPDHWRNPAYTDHNRAYMGNDVDVLENGEIIFPIAADVPCLLPHPGTGCPRCLSLLSRHHAGHDCGAGTIQRRSRQL